MRALAATSFIVLISTAALGQSPAASAAFDIADVHVSPRTDWVKNSAHRMDGGNLTGGRYEIRRATMLDLITTAYNIDADKVFGGPSWLDYDKFDIAAKTKPGTRPDTLRLMLQTLLADRFHLVLKTETQPVPGYVLTTGKGSLKLDTPASNSGSTGCQNIPHFDAESRYNDFHCRSATMEDFALVLHRLVSLPVQDSTGVDGGWDFEMQYPMANLAAGLPNTGVIEAVGKLGLKLEQGKVPQAVLTVQSVNEQPSANPPGVAEALPPLREPQFEVASRGRTHY